MEVPEYIELLCNGCPRIANLNGTGYDCVEYGKRLKGVDGPHRCQECINELKKEIIIGKEGKVERDLFCNGCSQLSEGINSVASSENICKEFSCALQRTDQGVLRCRACLGCDTKEKIKSDAAPVPTKKLHFEQLESDFGNIWRARIPMGWLVCACENVEHLMASGSLEDGWDW